MSLIRNISELVAIPFETVITFLQIFCVALKDVDLAEEILQTIRDYTEIVKVRKPFWEED